MHGCVQHPEEIVITRRDYLRYAEERAVLGGLFQSTILTKHILYIGFSLTDPNFHKMFDTVRKALEFSDTMCLRDRNTALFLKRSPLEKELWEADVHCVSMNTSPNTTVPSSVLARKLEIFLDSLASQITMQCAPAVLLDKRFQHLLSPAERKASEVLSVAFDNLKNIPGIGETAARKELEIFFHKIGSRSWSLKS